MGKKVCVLPCNGLDKSLGVVARDVALKLIEKNPDIELICPVLLNSGDEKYEELLRESDIIVIDGCMTRCATKLIDERSLRPSKKIFTPDMVKKYKLKPGASLILNEEGQKLAESVASEILDYLKESEEGFAEVRELGEIEYFETVVDKFHFRVPKSGYYFNENDCWVKLEGKKAFMGISDFLQNMASDIIFVEFPEIGLEFEQFDDVGTFESIKIVLQLITPASGKVVAVNKQLEQAPELLNKDPYGKGWFIEVELKNFEEDKELLMDGPAYFEYMKKKIEEERKRMK
ncbi:MAG: putative zinc-binding protein [Candidatus Jordarchaeum sp.]|uniref:putative zinc-binding protein n=1 Tax=Candidatus Jordarchaeum sp. TaxID=2823881 RepID=UPI00404ACA32